MASGFIRHRGFPVSIWLSKNKLGMNQIQDDLIKLAVEYKRLSKDVRLVVELER